MTNGIDLLVGIVSGNYLGDDQEVGLITIVDDDHGVPIDVFYVTETAWLNRCDTYRVSPREGDPPPWLAQPRSAA